MVDNPQDTGTQDPEEIKLEEDALKDTPEDEVKSKIIEDLALDEEADAELIGKLVSKELKGRKDLSTAIKQKRTWREKAQIEQKEPPKEEKKEGTPPSDDLDKKLDEVLTKRELNNLDVSDDAKKAVEFVVERDGCSIKKAMEDGVVKYHLQRDEEKKREEEASANASPKGQAATFSEVKTQEDITEWLKTHPQNLEENRKKYRELMKEYDKIPK